jgi:phospholipid-binding lipoprotein MlaA
VLLTDQKSVPRALAISLVILASLCASTSSALAELPADIARNIATTASAANALRTTEASVGQSLGNKSLQWIKARRARDSGDNALGSVVVTAISARPDLVSEIISTAVQVAPSSAQMLAKHTAHVFPGFAPVIARAAGLPLPSIQTSAYTDYIASPSYGAQPPIQVATRAPTLYRPVYPVVQSTQPPPRPLASVTPKRRVVADDQKIAPGYYGAEEISDPIEGLNRAVFAFNDALDIMIMRPVAALYGYLMPPPAKPAAQRFFKNLKAPVIMINDLVQLDGTDAAVTAGRFVINSTVGVLGLFEMADDFGLNEHRADFGQSLHSYGVAPGPYIVLPVLGPSTLRDGTGQVVDGFIDPFNYLLRADVRTARDVGAAVVGRESLVAGLDNLRNNSVDYYSALRAAWYQNRVLNLNKGRAGLAAATDKLTDDMFDDAE